MKRVFSLLICLALLLSLQPLTARAVQTFTISETGISLIKNYEGFRDVPYADSRGRWYVGYGTSCDPADYPYPITEADADLLLRQALAGKEEGVNEFLLDYNITVTQNQFDALVSMTYTLGTQWINPTYRLCSYLINGIWNYSEAEIVNAIATWCHVGTTVLDTLTERRLQEAYLFLYGQYPNVGSDNYCYIHFDPAGGEVENQTIFYPKGSIYGPLPAPENGTGVFQGWYTEDGTLLTGTEYVLEDITVTALWDGAADLPEKEEKPPIDLSTWVNPYGDVKETDWYYTYVRELSAKGIMGGYEDSTFRAERTLTAGEALKLILLAAGHPDPGNAYPGHWAANYLALAEQLGCVYPGEITDLDAPISRRSIANITAIAMGLQARYGASPFADSESGYLLTLYEEKILNGTIIGGKRYYYPDNNIIRSEVCAIISRISNWQYKEKNDPAQTGYIVHRDKFYPLQRNAAVAPYNPNLFVQDGSRMYYNDSAYRPAIGIDVSSYQGEIVWQKVAASGVEFAMIRLGFRGYGEEGTINLDQYFLQNLQGAKAAGIKTGVYFFSQAQNAEEAVEEAQFVLQILHGYTLEYPLVYDWETIHGTPARTDGMDSTEVTDCALAFCQLVEQYGYIPMIYCNSDIAYAKYQQNRLMDYDVWFAQYAQWPTMYYNYRIWQYTDSGTVPGIDTPVDMNIAMIPY